MTRSRKGNEANVERKVGDCWQWQATGQCSKGDSCGFSHGIIASGNGSESHKQKEPPNSKATPQGKGKSKSSDKKDESSVDERSKIPCQWRNCTNPSCNYWHPPVCEGYFSEAGCRKSRNCYFRHVELEEKPNKKSKKGGAKGSVRKDQLRIPRSSSEEVYFKERRTKRNQSQDSILTLHLAQHKNAGKKGSVVRYHSEVCAS